MFFDFKYKLINLNSTHDNINNLLNKMIENKLYIHIK
jgi:hypothetical protein